MLRWAKSEKPLSQKLTTPDCYNVTLCALRQIVFGLLYFTLRGATLSECIFMQVRLLLRAAVTTDTREELHPVRSAGMLC